MDDIERWLRDVLRLAGEIYFERADRELWRFTEALYDWLYELFARPRPGWQEGFASFVAEQQAQGRLLVPQSQQAIVDYLERWSATVDWESLARREQGASLAAFGPDAFLQLDGTSAASGSALAESPTFSADAARASADAMPSLERVSAKTRDPATPERGLLGFQFAARRLADEEQRLLNLNDQERREFEQFVFESLRAEANGTQPPLPPLGWWEKKGEWLQRQEAQPGMRGVTREEQDRSILQWKYDNLDKLPPDERNRLHSQRLWEQRREFAAKHGLLAAFLNPGFDGTGTMNDWGGGMSGFLQAAGGSQPDAQGFPSRGPRRGGQNRPPTQGGGKGGKQPKNRDPKKPRFPVPRDRDPAPKDPQTGKPIPEHERAALAEKEKAKFIHSLPNEVVIYWGEKIGTHGADVVSYNLRTKQVTLWDVKYRSDYRTIRRSNTFKKGSDALDNAVQKALEAIPRSALSPADKHAAQSSLENNTYEARTIGAGNAKNSTFGDNK
jgi:hypothetical protein